MNYTQLIVLQIFAHLLTDFIFQSDEESKEKNEFGFRSKFIIWHLIIAFILSWFFSFQLKFWPAALMIASSHFLVDGLKGYLNRFIWMEKSIFFLDQLIHIGLVLIITLFYYKIAGIDPIITVPFETKTLIIITGFLFCSKPSNILIREILFLFQIHYNDNSDLRNAGRLIGIIERFLVLLFILLNQFGAVGLLIAAKSILRFRNDESVKTEYVLIGTMLSFGLAITTGILIK